MSNRTLYPSQAFGANRKDMAFELLGGGAAANLTLSTDAKQCVASVSRSGTGVFVVTLKDAFVKCTFKSADLDDTANDGGYATCSDVTNEGTGSPLTFTIRVRAAAGTAADPALNRRIGVSLVFHDTVAWGMP